VVVSAFRSLRLGPEGRCRGRVKTGCKQQMSVKPLRRGRASGVLGWLFVGLMWGDLDDFFGKLEGTKCWNRYAL